MAEVVTDGNSGEWCDGGTLVSDPGGGGQEAGIWASVEMRQALEWGWLGW